MRPPQATPNVRRRVLYRLLTSNVKHAVKTLPHQGRPQHEVRGRLPELALGNRSDGPVTHPAKAPPPPGPGRRPRPKHSDGREAGRILRTQRQSSTITATSISRRSAFCPTDIVQNDLRSLAPPQGRRPRAVGRLGQASTWPRRAAPQSRQITARNVASAGTSLGDRGWGRESDGTAHPCQEPGNRARGLTYPETGTWSVSTATAPKHTDTLAGRESDARHAACRPALRTDCAANRSRDASECRRNPVLISTAPRRTSCLARRPRGPSGGTRASSPTEQPPPASG